AVSRPVTVRMLMNDVVTDAGMNGGRYRKTIARGEDTQVAMRPGALQYAAAYILAQAQRTGSRLRDPVVQFAGFTPQAKFSGADVARHAFGGGSDARQLEVVDRSRAVHGD